MFIVFVRNPQKAVKVCNNLHVIFTVIKLFLSVQWKLCCVNIKKRKSKALNINIMYSMKICCSFFTEQKFRFSIYFLTPAYFHHNFAIYNKCRICFKYFSFRLFVLCFTRSRTKKIYKNKL